MPSVLGAFLHKTLIPSATRFHGGFCSHRLKKLEKWNRRVWYLRGSGFVLCALGAIDSFPWRPVIFRRGDHGLLQPVSIGCMGCLSCGLRKTVPAEERCLICSISSCEQLKLSCFLCGIETLECTWMSSFNPRASPVSQAICCELVVCSHSSEKLNTEDKQVASCNMKDTVDAISEGIIISPIDEKPGVVVPVTEVDDGETVDCQVCYGQISVPNATSDQDETLVSNEINMCKEFSQPLSLDGNVHKCLSESKTFPVSREVQTYSSSTNGRADSPGAEEQGQNSSASGTSAYLRSISLPPSSTLVSAMKGGRELNGTVVRSELRVKWAPEVYDPPATSMSHTVTGHQRPKAKKKDKHKHKGKLSRGNTSERKRGNRKSSNKAPDPQNVRLQGNGDRLVLNGFGKSKVVDMFNYSVNGQKVKCGNSFLREALPKVHLPIGEAS